VAVGPEMRAWPALEVERARVAVGPEMRAWPALEMQRRRRHLQRRGQQWRLRIPLPPLLVEVPLLLCVVSPEPFQVTNEGFGEFD